MIGLLNLITIGQKNKHILSWVVVILLVLYIRLHYYSKSEHFFMNDLV